MVSTQPTGTRSSTTTWSERHPTGIRAGAVSRPLRPRATSVSTCVEDDLFNPFLNGTVDDPYRYYALRRAHAEVQRGLPPDPSGPVCWYALGYQAASRALTADHFGLEISRVVPAEYLPPPAQVARPFLELIQQWMILRDPPAHTRLRRAVAPAFTKDAVLSQGPAIRQIANQLLDDARLRGRMDLMTDFAVPLPILIIGRLLGVTDVDLRQIKDWSRSLLQGIDLKDNLSFDEAYVLASSAATQLNHFLRDLIMERRRSPRGDLISGMLDADLDESEIISSCALLLFAGHETTVNLIGNGMLALLRHPSQLDQLRNNLSALPVAIEELLRYDSPSQITFRYAMKSCELGGVHLGAGEPIGIVVGSANHDTSQFHEPTVLDLERMPNRHLSFGAGCHACIGAGLARLEAQIAFEAILSSFPQIELLTTTPRWSASRGIRGLSTLPLRVA
jgi:pimeloyl-[acyl-carrier protein] synthase